MATSMGECRTVWPLTTMLSGGTWDSLVLAINASWLRREQPRWHITLQVLDAPLHQADLKYSRKPWILLPPHVCAQHQQMRFVFGHLPLITLVQVWVLVQ